MLNRLQKRLDWTLEVGSWKLEVGSVAYAYFSGVV